jgi:hypothetical protein
MGLRKALLVEHLEPLLMVPCVHGRSFINTADQRIPPGRWRIVLFNQAAKPNKARTPRNDRNPPFWCGKQKEKDPSFQGKNGAILVLLTVQ